MNRKIIWIIAVTIVVIGFVVYRDNRSSDSDKTIKIAALLPLTGEASAWGENAYKAIQLATEEMNSRGGINGKQIEMIYEDTSGDPKKAVSAYRLVTSVKHVVAVIGPMNQTEDVAVMPLIDETNTPTIVPGFVPMQNRKNLHNPLLIWMDAETEAGRLAQYVFDQGIRKVAVIGTLDSWETTISNAFSEKFKSLGGIITETEIVQSTTDDMKLSVTKVIGSKPQAIFIGTYYQFVNSTKALRDLGYQGKLFSIEVDDYLASQTSGSTNGLQFIAPDYYKTDFVDRFKNRYGIIPGIPAGQSYDATNILFDFLAKSQEQSDILIEMRNFNSYTGVSGEVKIGADGRTSLPTALFEIIDGTVKRLILLQ